MSLQGQHQFHSPLLMIKTRRILKKEVSLLLAIQQILSMIQKKNARPAMTSFKPIFFYQERFNDNVTGFALSKQMTELLALRLQETTCFRNRWWFTHYRKGTMNLLVVFRINRPLCYCLLEKLVEKRIAFPH